MHTTFLKGLRKLENATWREVTGRDIQHVSYTLARHKLFFNYLFYYLLTLPGTTKLAETVDRVKEKHRWIIKKMKKGTWDAITDRQWSLLKPRLSLYPAQRLMKSLKLTLRDLEMNPSDFIDETDSQLIHLLLERYMPQNAPYNLLLLLEDADLPLLMQFIEGIKKAKSLARIRAEVNLLPVRYKKALKLILLLSNRYKEFTVSYADSNPVHLKCLECVPDNYKVNSTFVMCEYCREMLVYRDMRKRPASFGCYLQTECMEQRCYRDDSDQLRCIYCFDPDRYVSLVFAHPDRNEVGLCQGKRNCFTSVGFPDRKCTKCLMIQDDWQIHQDTCLDKRKDNLCRTCKVVLSSLDGTFPRRKEQDIVDKDADMMLQKKINERKMPSLLRLMESAKAWKERRKLIK